MIQFHDKKDCCGCAACVQRCPKKCIAMQEDEEGFLYPLINVNLCIDCGLCERVCPVINQNDPKEPLGVYAAKNPNEEVRLKSSSGGIFTMLAESVIDEGGVVFGVGYNEHWEAVHSYTETKEGIIAFRMSKYIQSIVGNTFKEAESFLKHGRKVLYSGTPCQIAGLKKFLRKEYDNLLTIDFICHGVPSPGVFRWYLGEEMVRTARKSGKKYSFALQSIPQIPKADVLAKEYGYEIKDIRFRDKLYGWKKFSFALDLSEETAEGEKNSVLLSYTLDKSAFLKGFLKDLYLRPSCHSCVTKQLKSGSDITIGDFWGIETLKPEMNDNNGVSVIVENTAKGQDSLVKLELMGELVDYVDLCNLNPSILYSSKQEKLRDEFFAKKNLSFFTIINKLCKVPLKTRFMILLINFIKMFLGNRGYKYIKHCLKL